MEEESESARRESIRNHDARARAHSLARIFLHLHAIFELFRASGGEEWIYDSIKRVCPAIFRLVPQNDSTIASRMALEKPPGGVCARRNDGDVEKKKRINSTRYHLGLYSRPLSHATLNFTFVYGVSASMNRRHNETI